ncbi:MAG: hypothetical protein MJ120_05260 [Clostridia bacterium]|nr:hypothetical protein [Clostridia bacterium]
MADDEKKLTNGEAEESAEAKDWQWDASAPMAGEDFLTLSALADEDEEEDAEETADEATEEIAEEAEISEEATEEKAENEEETAEEAADENGETPPGYCIICGEKIRNSKSEYYCNECRSKYMKVDYGATHIILSVLMVFIAVFGIVMFTATSKISGSISEADKLLKDGKISAASDAYSDVDITVETLNERFNAFLHGISENIESVTFFNGGKKSDQKRAEILAKTFSLSYDDADTYYSLVESSFTEKQLNSPKYAQVKGCYDYLKKFLADYTTMNEDLQNAYKPLFDAAYTGDADADELSKMAKDVVNAIDKYAAEHTEIGSDVVSYFKYSMLYFAEQNYGIKIDSKDLYSYVLKAYEGAGKFDYLYYQDVASLAFTVDEYNVVLDASNKALEQNPSNSDAYYFKAAAYLRLEKFDEALEACDKLAEYSTDPYDNVSLKANVLRRQGQFLAAADICDSVPAANKSSEISRQEAIAYYLAGDEDNALKYAKESYDIAYSASYNGGGAFSLETVNTSALIYKLCGDDEDYDAVLEALKQSDEELEDSVMAVIKGDATFEDLFMTGKGDI